MNVNKYNIFVMWKKVLREYFAYSRKERRGLLILFILWLALLFYQQYKYRDSLLFFNPNGYQISYQNEVRKFDSISYAQLSNNTPFKVKVFPKYFNYATKYDFENLGINEKQILKLIALQKNGLKIYTRDDLLQCKEIDSTTINILTQHLKFFQEKKYFRPNEARPIENIIIDINTADTLQLDQVRGISKGLAKRIVNYRERLGGYIKKEQLQEIWGMDSLSYTSLVINTRVISNNIKPININTADINALGKHPYIGYALAKIIVNYRTQHGPYQKVEDLFNIHVMNADIFSKIEVYISVNEH
ncbi:MAG: helix-hairpin-helix domain-containing protein [Sphingobacteriales bacterium]|nr:helix-hairpin-helix domain-containing protein [Sphingobacteriales bacterium]